MGAYSYILLLNLCGTKMAFCVFMCC